MIRDNIIMAKDKSQPLCQDTGVIICYADLPAWCDETTFRKAYEKAVVQATKVGYLRQNSVDSITGKNSGNNLGPGSPSFHFHPAKGKSLRVRMMLKGGGCENSSAQYSLPDNRIGAGRDLEGVRRCLLDALVQAQGKGCGPGILGVCIGGDRGSGLRRGQGDPVPSARRQERGQGPGPAGEPDHEGRQRAWASAPWASAATPRCWA